NMVDSLLVVCVGTLARDAMNHVKAANSANIADANWRTCATVQGLNGSDGSLGWSGQAVTSNRRAEPGKPHDADDLTRSLSTRGWRKRAGHDPGARDLGASGSRPGATLMLGPPNRRSSAERS